MKQDISAGHFLSLIKSLLIIQSISIFKSIMRIELLSQSVVEKTYLNRWMLSLSRLVLRPRNVRNSLTNIIKLSCKSILSAYISVSGDILTTKSQKHIFFKSSCIVLKLHRVMRFIQRFFMSAVFILRY